MFLIHWGYGSPRTYASGALCLSMFYKLGCRCKIFAVVWISCICIWEECWPFLSPMYSIKMKGAPRLGSLWHHQLVRQHFRGYCLSHVRGSTQWWSCCPRNLNSGYWDVWSILVGPITCRRQRLVFISTNPFYYSSKVAGWWYFWGWTLHLQAPPGVQLVQSRW